MAARTRPVRSRVPPHTHQPTDLPADHRGRRECRVCRLFSQPGDARHPITPPTPISPVLAAAAAARDAAILGEHDDD